MPHMAPKYPGGMQIWGWDSSPLSQGLPGTVKPFNPADDPPKKPRWLLKSCLPVIQDLQGNSLLGKKSVSDSQEEQ